MYPKKVQEEGEKPNLQAATPMYRINYTHRQSATWQWKNPY
jgi:hypothetical protein